MCLTSSHHRAVFFVVDRTVKTVAERRTLEGEKEVHRTGGLYFSISSSPPLPLYPVFSVLPLINATEDKLNLKLTEQRNHIAKCQTATPRLHSTRRRERRRGFFFLSARLPCAQEEFYLRPLPPSADGTPSPPRPHSLRPSS